MNKNDKGKWFWVSLGLQGVYVIALLLLGVNSYFIKAELSQIRQDREQIYVLREFMAATKANSFTSQDGLKVYEEIARIREELAKVPSQSPPQWFEDMVSDLKNSVDELTQQVIKNGTEIEHIKQDVGKIKNVY